MANLPSQYFNIFFKYIHTTPNSDSQKITPVMRPEWSFQEREIYLILVDIYNEYLAGKEVVSFECSCVSAIIYQRLSDPEWTKDLFVDGYLNLSQFTKESTVLHLETSLFDDSFIHAFIERLEWYFDDRYSMSFRPGHFCWDVRKDKSAEPYLGCYDCLRISIDDRSLLSQTND